MRNWIFITIIIAFGLLQASILNCVTIFNVKPDLLLISAVTASLFFESRWAIFCSIFAGMLKDVFSVNAFGINVLLFFAWSFLVIKLSRKITIDNNYVRFALILTIVILNNIIVRLIFLFSDNFIPWGIFLRIIFIESLYTAFILPLIFKLTSTIANKRVI